MIRVVFPVGARAGWRIACASVLALTSVASAADRHSVLEPAGPAVQQPPGELPQPAKSTGPIAPALAPPTPAWKQEVKGEPESGSEG